MPKRRKKSIKSLSFSRDDERAIKMVMRMMAIRGGSGREERVAAFVLKTIRAAGAPESAMVVEQPPRKKIGDATTGNVILKLPGTIRGPRRMLSAHLDTVPVCVGSRPVRKGNRVVAADANTGLGADDRAGATVLLLTAVDLLKNKTPHPPVTFLWSVQEEIGMVGACHVRLGNLGRPKLAFNFDGRSPTDLIIGATGGIRITIDVTGLAAHAGGHPEEGVSAIAIASLAIADLQQNGWHGLIEKGRKVGTSNFGVIHGGVATNVVNDHVQIRAEARSHDPAFRKHIVDEIETAFFHAAKSVCNTAGQCGDARFDSTLDYESFRLPLDTPSAAAAAVAIEAVGHDPNYSVANGGLDANWLSARGIPTVTLGCGQHNIHSVDEELDLPEFLLARRIALRLATGAS